MRLIWSQEKEISSLTKGNHCTCTVIPSCARHGAELELHIPSRC